MPERILLIGMMGAGKTSVGRRLAARLGWEHVDSDDQVERATGRTVAEIFAADGEAAFRREERAALLGALAASVPSVVSVAGGAVLDPANRQAIKAGGTVVWLRASVATLAERVGEGQGRPLLAGDPAGALARLLPEREPLYAQLADVVLEVEGRGPDDLAGAIVEHCRAASA